MPGLKLFDITSVTMRHTLKNNKGENKKHYSMFHTHFQGKLRIRQLEDGISSSVRCLVGSELGATAWLKDLFPSI